MKDLLISLLISFRGESDLNFKKLTSDLKERSEMSLMLMKWESDEVVYTIWLSILFLSAEKPKHAVELNIYIKQKELLC